MSSMPNDTVPMSTLLRVATAAGGATVLCSSAGASIADILSGATAGGDRAAVARGDSPAAAAVYPPT